MCDDNDNGFFQFFAGSLNLQPEKAAELLLRFARKCPMECTTLRCAAVLDRRDATSQLEGAAERKFRPITDTRRDLGESQIGFLKQLCGNPMRQRVR